MLGIELTMLDKNDTVDKTLHPAWDRYNKACRLWENLVEQTAAAYSLMNDIADELERAGEMVKDYR